MEQQLACVLQQPVLRDDILEVGNLAALDGHARLLILALIQYLVEQLSLRGVYRHRSGAWSVPLAGAATSLLAGSAS